MNVNKFKYDYSRYDFLGLIISYFHKSTKFKSIKSLQDILTHCGSEDVALLEQIMYECFHSNEFQKLYEEFDSEIIEPIFGKNYGIQRIPSVRISFPGSKTVNFHNDCWYGHGKEIINVWLPLTNVSQTQCLAFLSKAENKKALKYFYDSEPSLVDIQKYCEERAYFMELNYGQFITFPTKALHGAFKNQSNEIRISFDFRICVDNNIGFKNLNFFKFKTNIEKIKSDINDKNKTDYSSIGYISQKSIFDDYVVSQTIQQEAIISYCNKNNLKLLVLETELMGFSKPLNLEDIICGNRKGLAKNIIVFSDKILNRDNVQTAKLVDIAIKENYIFHFINEGYLLKKERKSVPM